MTKKVPSGPRSIALVGPYSSGKTTLMESMLFVAEAIGRKGTVKDGNTVGDASTEARARQMSVEVSPATFTYMDEVFTVLDCPGSLEFLQESFNALIGVDAAVVVCEPDSARAGSLAPLLHFLVSREIPYFLFVNKMDRATEPVQAFLSELQAVAGRPLVLRQVPIMDGESIDGYIDLVLERAYKYGTDKASDQIPIPDEMAEDEQAARTELLETLADFDDSLLEQLLEDVVPPSEEIFDALHKDFAEGLIVPVMLGSAENQSGVRRLMKALRHDLPEPEVSAGRAGLAEGDDTLIQVLKTYHTASSGKLSLTRVWRGTVQDGMSLGGHRIGSINRMMGQTINKVTQAAAGEIVALGRMDELKTGEIWSSDKDKPEQDSTRYEVLKPVYAMAVTAENRADEVKLSEALSKITDEDPSLIAESNPDTNEMILWGQGDIHLKVALERAKSKFNVGLTLHTPKIPYKETVRKPVERVQGRHKKQSGGHGQFGDVFIDVKPLPRGQGVEFNDTITGGVVPKQYIPAVEAGVRTYCKKGPLGFEVVDVGVTLVFGSYHTVDSSEMAFQTAARIAMNEAMPKCGPVLLEPIYHVDVFVPNEYTPQVQRLLSGRRAQILGFGAREGWDGWDVVSAHLPQAEMQDLIIELRSLTRGVGTYDYRFDHLQELTGKLADDVVAAYAEAAQ